jgi:CheY-like chemotaxis protein
LKYVVQNGVETLPIVPGSTWYIFRMKAGTLRILLVEDEENDVHLVQRATLIGGANHTVQAVGNGNAAIRYLRGEGQYADRKKFPLPNVILTDLKMPEMDGLEFLRWLRTHPESAVIPTIVFSSSALEADVQEAYRLGANAYISKPPTLNELVEILRVIFEFWSRCQCPAMPNGR